MQAQTAYVSLRVCACTEISIVLDLIIVPEVIVSTDRCWLNLVDYDINIVCALTSFSVDALAIIHE